MTVGQAIANENRVVSIPESASLEDIQKSADIMSSNQSVYPILNADGTLHGLLPRNFLTQLPSPAISGKIIQYVPQITQPEITYSDYSLREALNQMMLNDKIVLPVITDKKS